MRVPKIDVQKGKMMKYRKTSLESVDGCRRGCTADERTPPLTHCVTQMRINYITLDARALRRARSSAHTPLAHRPPLVIGTTPQQQEDAIARPRRPGLACVSRVRCHEASRAQAPHSRRSQPLPFAVHQVGTHPDGRARPHSQGAASGRRAPQCNRERAPPRRTRTRPRLT